MVSLPVKYRPKTFDDMVWHTSVIQVLKRQIETGNIKNAYLFAGHSGNGKTTCAKCFASLVNSGSGTPIEIDAASNNGVDNIRSLVQEASERSLDSKYKVIILDECFVGETLVSTPRGYKRIEDINVGDKVLNISGVATVKNKVRKEVPKCRMVDVVLGNGKKITCTDNHLFMTTCGYVEASKLLPGDELIYDKNMRSLWEGVQCQEKEHKGVLKEVRKSSFHKEQRLQEGLTSIQAYMRNLWNDLGDHKEEFPEDLFKEVLFHLSIDETEGVLCISTRGCSEEIIIRTCKDNCRLRSRDREEGFGYFREDEEKQPIFKSRNSKEDVGNKKGQRNIWIHGRKGWKWEIDCTPRETVRIVRRFMGNGISSEDKLSPQKSVSLSYMLQVRPRLSKDDDRDRGGWQFSQLEKGEVSRYKERNFTDTVRVEDIKVYKQGSNGESRKGDGGTITVYDLTIEGHPSYFANGVLVHNCQALTAASWNALLKTIEEPPKFTIFILCTTDPQKIPETILNRVQRFNFGAIPYDKIVDRLRYVCEQEGFTNYEESIECIGKACSGCMREALTLLGKVADSGTNFDIENTLSILGEVPVSVYTKLINYLIDGDEKGVLSSLDEIEESGTEIKDFISALLKFVVDVAKYILFNSLKSTSIPETFENEIKSITNFDNAIGYYNYVMDKLLKLKMDITSDEDASTTVRVVCLQIARIQ